MLHIIVVTKANPKFSPQGKNIFFFYFVSIGGDECLLYLLMVIIS